MDQKASHPHFMQPYFAEIEKVKQEAALIDDLTNNTGDVTDEVDSASSDDELIDLKKKIEREKKKKEVNTHVMKMLRDSAGKKL
jgi:hypothetical protein